MKQVLKEFSVKPKPVGKPTQYVPSKGGTTKTVKEKWSWNFIEHLRVRIAFREGLQFCGWKERSRVFKSL